MHATAYEDMSRLTQSLAQTQRFLRDPQHRTCLQPGTFKGMCPTTDANNTLSDNAHRESHEDISEQRNAGGGRTAFPLLSGTEMYYSESAHITTVHGVGVIHLS